MKHFHLLLTLSLFYVLTLNAQNNAFLKLIDQQDKEAKKVDYIEVIYPDTIKQPNPSIDAKYAIKLKDYNDNDTIFVNIKDKRYKDIEEAFTVQKLKLNIEPSIKLEKKKKDESNLIPPPLPKHDSIKIPIKIIDTILMEEINKGIEISPVDIILRNNLLIIPPKYKGKEIELIISHKDYKNDTISIKEKQPIVKRFLQSNKYITLSLKDTLYGNAPIENVQVTGTHGIMPIKETSDNRGEVTLRVSPLANSIRLTFQKPGYESIEDKSLNLENQRTYLKSIYLKGNKEIRFDFRNEANDIMPIDKFIYKFDTLAEKLTNSTTIAYSPKCDSLTYSIETKGYKPLKGTIYNLKDSSQISTVKIILKELEIRVKFFNNITGIPINEFDAIAIRCEQKTRDSLPLPDAYLKNNKLSIKSNTAFVSLQFNQGDSLFIDSTYQIEIKPNRIEYPIYLVPYCNLELYIHQPNGKLIVGREVEFIAGQYFKKAPNHSYEQTTNKDGKVSFLVPGNEQRVTIGVKPKKRDIYKGCRAIDTLYFSTLETLKDTMHIRLARKKWIPKSQDAVVGGLAIAANILLDSSDQQLNKAKDKGNANWIKNRDNAKILDAFGYASAAVSAVLTTIFATRSQKDTINYCTCMLPDE